MKFLEDIKKKNIVLAIGFLLLGCGSAFAQGPGTYLVSLDENGNGTLELVGLFGVPLSFGSIPDLGPGGLPAALFYDMLNPAGLTDGDVIILEPETGLPGDVLRFSSTASLGNGNGTGGVYVYSLVDVDPKLADTGLPSLFNDNQITLTESNGEVLYTPAAGQPGYVQGLGPVVTYDFVSDPPVPEPGSILMLTGGLAILGVGIRRKTRRSKA